VSVDNIDKTLLLNQLGDKVAELIKEVYPNLYGSVKFNFKKGSFCNLEIIEHIEKK